MPVKMDLHAYIRKFDILRAKLIDQLTIEAERELEELEEAEQVSMEGALNG